MLDTTTAVTNGNPAGDVGVQVPPATTAVAAPAEVKPAPALRPYVVLEKVPLAELVSRALAPAEDAGDLTPGLVDSVLDALSQDHVYVEVMRGEARNADVMLDGVGEALQRNATVLCPPASAFRERTIQVQTQTRVVVG